MAVAKACGATRIIAVDLVQSKLDFAKSYAATDVYLPPKKLPDEGKIEYSRRIAEAMKKELGIADMGPDAIDLALDASGAEACVETGLFVLKRGGTFVQVGLGVAEMVLPITTVLVRELVVKGAFRFGVSRYS
jgi:D-xylulose reductase